jgi:transposase
MPIPKAMIRSANRCEPRDNNNNNTVLDFTRHYGTSILPARACHPQDKAKAESAVHIVERWIKARLRHQQFASVHEVNIPAVPLLTRLNDKLFRNLQGSRT